MKTISKIALLTALALPFATHAANPAESTVLTSKYYVDSGLEQKANKAAITDAGEIAIIASDGDYVGSGVTAGDLTDMATQTWVDSQGYLTDTNLADKIDAAMATKQDAITCTAGQIIQYDASGIPGCATVVAGPYQGN